MTPMNQDAANAARTACQTFALAFEPLRPELYRFCRHLTRSPWDAEDLVQDTLARALVQLGQLIQQNIVEPRAWLFRVASNLWIDRVRRARDELGEVPESATSHDPRATREAAGTLIARLSPQERVAVVLKEAFDLSLDEIAATLGTSVGAVKAALHRGRGKLAQTPDTEETRVPRPAALDAFCDAFNAGDLPALTALLLDTVTVELVGAATDLGKAATVDPRMGIVYHTLLSPLGAGTAERYLGDIDRTSRARAELRLHRGEHILLLWFPHASGDKVRSVLRFDLGEDGTKVARLREYYFSPDMLVELCAELGVPCLTNGHGLPDMA